MGSRRTRTPLSGTSPTRCNGSKILCKSHEVWSDSENSSASSTWMLWGNWCFVLNRIVVIFRCSFHWNIGRWNTDMYLEVRSVQTYLSHKHSLTWWIPDHGYTWRDLNNWVLPCIYVQQRLHSAINSGWNNLTAGWQNGRLCSAPQLAFVYVHK